LAMPTRKEHRFLFSGYIDWVQAIEHAIYANIDK